LSSSINYNAELIYLFICCIGFKYYICYYNYKGGKNIIHLKSKKILTMCIAIFILITLTLSLAYNVSPSLIKCSSDLNLIYDEKITSQQIIPLSDGVTFPVNISYKISGRFANFVEKYLIKNSQVTVDLSIKNKPKWCTARISPNVVNPTISSQWQSKEAYVHISITELAPAFEKFPVEIEMHSHEISNFFYKIEEGTNTAILSFIPRYLPIIDAVPKSTIKEVKPGEIVTFDIDLENLGNAETVFIFKITEVPKGWSASMVSAIKIGTKLKGEDSTKTVQLNIQPPYEPGHYNEQEDIRIEVFGMYSGSTTGQELRTDTYELTFTVRVRGTLEDASTSGINPIVLILLLIIITLIIIIIIMTLFIKKRHLR